MRVLLVEDERKLAASLKKALESERFAVDVSYDGEEGYGLAAVEEYDAIILDLGLPTLGGLSVSKKLRSEGIKTPILMLTARDTVNDKVSGFESGADDYLIKPFAFEELLVRLRALIRRTQQKTDLVLKVDSLVLDPAAKTVKRKSKAINLRAKEYALLEFLISHAGTIVSRSQLIDHVWDSSLDPFSNVVDVYIGYLREKIDKNFPNEKPLIHTIKGMGYKIDV